jgi:Fe-S-cluster containining protein
MKKATADIFECDGCGLCCNGSLIVEASALDLIREPRIQEAYPLTRGKNLDVKLPILEACWVLGCGKRCSFLGTDNRCGIYATRPNTCVAFAAGSVKCQGLRKDAGLSPLVAVARPLTALTEIARDSVADDEDEWE